MIKKAANKAISATNGKKTYITAICVLIVSLLRDKVPFIAENELIIEEILEYALEFGVIHKIWRNRKDIIKMIIFKSNKLNNFIKKLWKKEKAS
jgi:hypothetical protein